MGTFSCSMRIASLEGGGSHEIEVAVDTGAFLTTVPARLLRELGIAPTGKRTLRLADGRVIERNIGEARATINDKSTVTQVAFGDDNDPPLLGAYTLEGLFLAVDPVGQRLVPVEVHPM